MNTNVKFTDTQGTTRAGCVTRKEISMYVAELRCYPVKSLRGYSVKERTAEQIGFAGDRRWVIIDQANKFLTQRQHPKLAQIQAVITRGGLELRHSHHGTVEVDYPPETTQPETVHVWRDAVRAQVANSASEYLSTFLGLPSRLAFLHDVGARAVDPAFGEADDRVSFADGFPYLVTQIGSLDDLNERLGNPISMDRFRANIVIAGAPAWAEDTWRRICLGQIIFRLVKPCSRCAIPTFDPLTGERPDGNEPLQTLAKFRRDATGGIMFGQNAIAETMGQLRVGEEVKVLEVGAPNVQTTTKL
jgi:uncharacterized protein